MPVILGFVAPSYADKKTKYKKYFIYIDSIYKMKYDAIKIKPKERRQMKKKIVSIVVAVVLLVSIAIPVQAASLPFTDVLSSQWYWKP